MQAEGHYSEGVLPPPCACFVFCFSGLIYFFFLGGGGSGLSELSGSGCVFKSWDRGKLKTGKTYWDCRESWGLWPRSWGLRGWAGQRPAGARWGLRWVPAWAEGDGDTTEGHTLLLWDHPRGARCGEVRRDQSEDFVLPNALITAEGESGKGQSGMALPRLGVPYTAQSASSLRKSRSRLGFCSVLFGIRTF